MNAGPHNDAPVQVHETAHNDAEVTPFLESAELDALENDDYALDDSAVRGKALLARRGEHLASDAVP